MNHPNYIHTPDDDRGPRRVTVSGRDVKCVFYADTRRGVVRYYPEPFKVHKHGKRAITRTKRGKVEVFPL